MNHFQITEYVKEQGKDITKLSASEVAALKSDMIKKSYPGMLIIVHSTYKRCRTV